jgi:Spy/CpxP family protein refolding chaperone
MLRKKRLLVWVPVLVVGLMFLGGCRHPSPEGIADNIIEDLTENLELNATQQQQLQVIKGELLAEFAEMKKARGSHHEEIYAELQKDVLDQGHLKNMVNARKAKMDDIANLMIGELAKFHSTLSPEQKKKLVEYLKKKEKFHNRCAFGG